jgi:hypothetical protein
MTRIFIPMWRALPDLDFLTLIRRCLKSKSPHLRASNSPFLIPVCSAMDDGLTEILKQPFCHGR